MVYGIVLPTLDVIIFDCKATYNGTPSVYMLTPFRSSKLDTSLQRGVSIESIHVRSYCLNCGSRSNVVRNWSFFRSFQCQKSAFLQCYWMPPPRSWTCSNTRSKKSFIFLQTPWPMAWSLRTKNTEGTHPDDGNPTGPTLTLDESSTGISLLTDLTGHFSQASLQISSTDFTTHMSCVNSKEFKTSLAFITAFITKKTRVIERYCQIQWWFNIEKPKISRPVVPFEFFRKVEKKLGEWRSACDAWPKIVNVSLNTAALN